MAEQLMTRTRGTTALSHALGRVPRVPRDSAVVLAALAILTGATSTETDVTLASPNGALRIVAAARSGRLGYEVTLKDKPVIERSDLGLWLDGEALGTHTSMGRVERYSTDQRYATNGMHSMAVDQSNGVRIRATDSGVSFQIELRAQDDAVAFRFVIDAGGTHVPDAGSTFHIPAGSLVWTHGLGGHYESTYINRRIDDVGAGEWVGPPLTFKLPQGLGYASITEAGLRNYSGMVLQSDGSNVYRERLGHSAPANYPFTLRYGTAEASRLAKPAQVEGPVTTPWRVILVGDLNALVTSDAIQNLSPPPDPKLFPHGARTSWLRPGRAVWRYLDGGENTAEGIKEFSRLAGELGFEYQVVEGIWAKWTDAELRDVIDYSNQRKVRLILWRHRNTLGDAAARRALFARLAAIGVAGLKVDFFDHEAKEVIDLYHDILKDAADARLVIDFHGANKPAGESRTWPNELTREGIYGLEHRSSSTWAEFNTTFPFTRLLAGHADYTPVVFGDRRKETSWAHQIATAVVLTSPLMVYGGHPQSFLSSPAVDLLKAIPSVWDETRVLPPSEIGQLAVFARRSGDRWFVAALNGPEARTVTLPLSFLGEGSFTALMARDDLADGGAIGVETKSVRRDDAIEVRMRAGGGFVARIGR